MDAVIGLFSFRTNQFALGYGWVLMDGFVKRVAKAHIKGTINVSAY